VPPPGFSAVVSAAVESGVVAAGGDESADSVVESSPESPHAVAAQAIVQNMSAATRRVVAVAVRSI
jgi:hypothetical protein